MPDLGSLSINPAAVNSLLSVQRIHGTQLNPSHAWNEMSALRVYEAEIFLQVKIYSEALQIVEIGDAQMTQIRSKSKFIRVFMNGVEPEKQLHSNKNTSNDIIVNHTY